MSKLFALFFPRYYFELQREVTISFDPSKGLPFEIDVINGCLYVGIINAKENELITWTNKGLQEGLRVIKINGLILPDKMSKEQWDTKLAEAESESNFDISFREEVNLSYTAESI